MVGLFDAAIAADDPACWEIGPGNTFMISSERSFRIINNECGLDHSPKL